MNISDRVQEIIQDCESNYLEIQKKNDKIKYNQREIVKQINCYINNEYYHRSDNNALFWNISNHRITHFAKHLSPDTKDFMPYGIGEINHFQSWVLKKKVKEYFDDVRFYQDLNDISEGQATYGSHIWKKYKENGKKKLKEVNLLNIYFDQSVEWIKDADGIVEIHPITKKQLWDKIDVWDNVEEVADKMENNDEIWEFYGYYGKGEPEYKHVIGYGYGKDFVSLWEEEVGKEDNPYEDFHLGKYRGRWLRIGVVERLFDLQARANQLVNQNAQATEIASLLLLKSANPDSVGNVLEQALNGQIIPDESLEQIGLSNTGLNQFINELQLIEQQADKLCLTPDIIQGESSPSNTTFRGIATVNANAISAFRDYKQNLLEKIADILMDYIFPDVVKGWDREELVEMTEDDVDVEEFDKQLMKRAEIETLLTGRVIDNTAKEQILEKMEEAIAERGRKVKIHKGFFNFKWGFKMMPTNETVDKAAQNDAYFNALQWTMQNPDIVEIPMFKQYCEDNNISAWKLTPKQKQQVQQGQNREQLDQPRQPDRLLQQANPQE
jgi:hypothetical protein